MVAVVLHQAESTLAATSPPAERTMTEVEGELTKRLGCVWRQTEQGADCEVPPLPIVVWLTRDPVDDTVETVEMMARIATKHARVSPEPASRRVVIDTVGYLLQRWSGATAWSRRALDDALNRCAKHVAEMEGKRLLIQWVQPGDREVTYANVVVTKRRSLEEWACRDGCPNCPEEPGAR
jgi:hypothetical protein